MSKWVPDRKVIAGGTVAVLSWALMLAAGAFGVEVPLELQALLPTALGYLVSYVVPASVQDVIKRIDDALVQIAGASPASAVSREVGEAAAAARGGIKATGIGELLARIGPGA